MNKYVFQRINNFPKKKITLDKQVQDQHKSACATHSHHHTTSSLSYAVQIVTYGAQHLKLPNVGCGI